MHNVTIRKMKKFQSTIDVKKNVNLKLQILPEVFCNNLVPDCGYCKSEEIVSLFKDPMVVLTLKYSIISHKL